MGHGDGGGDAIYKDKQLIVTRTVKPAGFRFVGEIDISNSGAIHAALKCAMDGAPNPHLDLTRLIFCDVSGIRSLVSASQLIGPDRRLLLHGLAPEFERVIRVIGWADQPSFSFCGCAEVQA